MQNVYFLNYFFKSVLPLKKSTETAFCEWEGGLSGESARIRIFYMGVSGDCFEFHFKLGN